MCQSDAGAGVVSHLSRNSSTGVIESHSVIIDNVQFGSSSASSSAAYQRQVA
jgi:hypothetical protein